MRLVQPALCAPLILFVLVLAPLGSASAQPAAPPQLPTTPLSQDILTLLANEISGQMAYDNEVKLAGAPWVRGRSEFTDGFYEAKAVHDLVRSYGIENTRLERFPSPRTFDYPTEGEFWTLEPSRRLIARIGADPALVASGSATADVTGELVYIPPLSTDDVKKMQSAGPDPRYKGRIALMWSHAREEAARALDAAGIVAVVSFNSRERYNDPNQVVYGGGSYKNENLAAGFNLSWRQWSELLEDVLSGRKVVVRARAKVESFKDRFEAVYSWIPGTEPDKKGVIFTAHLFEGYLKRGANDNMSGVVVQLEILRALSRLIASGELPRPRRTIYFLWPNEISGTYEFIKQKPGVSDRWSINVNMDMVGEWLRKNNSLFTMSECPDHLPSYLDGLAASVMNYVWRTNDIVYLPDSPRGRPGGQYFPVPMTEKAGSDDAFRFYVHRATGGSDHICFNNPSVAVPGIEFFTWPDQWYHADLDTPDKSDPTQMKRVAFIGAAVAWAAANCTDEVVAGLVDAVSSFGYRRIGERELPRALAYLDAADAASLETAAARAANLVEHATGREIAALRSIGEIHSGSPAAASLVNQRVAQWELYRAGLKSQIQGYMKVRADALGWKPAGSKRPAPTARPAAAGAALAAQVPRLAPGVRGREFSLGSYQPYEAYMKEHPEALKTLGVTPTQAATIANYVNGRRTVADIRNAVAAETDRELTNEAVAGYLDILKTVNWVVYQD
ncbi:MAG: M28 family peptidase [Vicinamibacterales bacterium]